MDLAKKNNIVELIENNMKIEKKNKIIYKIKKKKYKL